MNLETWWCEGVWGRGRLSSGDARVWREVKDGVMRCFAVVQTLNRRTVLVIRRSLSNPTLNLFEGGVGGGPRKLIRRRFSISNNILLPLWKDWISIEMKVNLRHQRDYWCFKWYCKAHLIYSWFQARCLQRYIFDVDLILNLMNTAGCLYIHKSLSVLSIMNNKVKN